MNLEVAGNASTHSEDQSKYEPSTKAGISVSHNTTPNDSKFNLHHLFSPEILTDLRSISKSDNYHSLLAVAFDLAIISLVIFACLKNSWLYPLGILVIGARQRGFTTILHDAAHGRAAANKRLNRIIGSYLSGYLIFQAFTAYRQSHVMDHHGHFGDKDKDPDFKFYMEANLYGISKKEFFKKQVLETILMLNGANYLWYVVKHRIASLIRHKTELLGFALFWTVIGALLTLTSGWRVFLLYWIIPYITTFLIIGRFIEIAEHFPLLDPDSPKTDILCSRNRFSHWLEACFLSIHGENYHLVHHLRPDIPFWNIRKAHMMMMRDPLYATVNSKFGGVFISSNDQPAVIPGLVRGSIALPGQARAS